MPDGSIRVVTKLDNSQLKQQIKDLERELKNIQKEQAKVDAQMDGAMARYQAEKEFDAQFPEEFSHRKEIDARAAQELDPLIAKQEELNQAEREHMALIDAKKAKLAEVANIEAAVKQVDSAAKVDSSARNVQTQAQYNSLLDATAAKMAAWEAAAGQVAAQTGLTKEQILAASKEYQKLSATMGMLKSKAADFGNEAQDAGKKTDKAMKRAEKSTKKVGRAARFGIMHMIKMNLIMMGVMSVIRGISSATEEYMAVNSKLEGQMNTLKALWGQVLGPAIEWVINLLMKAVSAVNAFVYALTGINYVARANEAALKKQAKAAGAAQGASFDEQNKVGGGSANNDPVTLLDDSVNNISDKLREMIESGDWFGAGEALGESLSDGIKSIDWESVGTTIGDIIGGAFSFVLGLVLNIDSGTITTSVLNLATGLLDSLSGTIQSLDWGAIGGTIVDLLFGGITALFSPDGERFVEAAAEFVGSIVGAIVAAVKGAGEKIAEIGTNLWNGIKGYFDQYVDWEGTPGDIIQGLWNGIVAALSSAGTWIHDNIWVPFRDGFCAAFGIHSPSKEMENFGGYIIEGLFGGITSALSGIGTWIHDNIWEPFRKWFCEAFDIHSPSKKMEDFGGNIIDGLFNGITGAIDKIKQACTDVWTTIQGVFSSVGTWFQTTFSNAWQKVKDVFSKGGKIFDGIKEGIASTFANIVNGLIDGINRVIRVPFNAINGMLNTIRSVEVLGFAPFKNLWGYNPLSVPQIPKLATSSAVSSTSSYGRGGSRDKVLLLARGGIVNRPGRGVPAIVGEAGAEAVLPLENNTEWMDILADKIGGGTITIPIMLDGKKIATYVVDIQKKRAFATNGV